MQSTETSAVAVPNKLAPLALALIIRAQLAAQKVPSPFKIGLQQNHHQLNGYLCKGFSWAVRITGNVSRRPDGVLYSDIRAGTRIQTHPLS